MPHLRGKQNPEKAQEKKELHTEVLPILRNASWRDTELAETVNLKPRNQLRRILVRRHYEGVVEEKVVKHIPVGEILTDSRGRGFYQRFM